jgi:hypothetical protein
MPSNHPRPVHCEGDREGVQGGLPPDEPSCLPVPGEVKVSGSQVEAFHDGASLGKCPQVFTARW